MPSPPAVPALRLFAAVAPAPPVRAALHALQQAWLSSLGETDPVARRSLRPVDAGALHLTLRFYGATPAEQLPQLHASLAADAAAATRSKARLQRLEQWPVHAPRTVVATFDAPPALLALAQALEASARALGFVPEPRGFRAHATLARGRGQALPRLAVALPDISMAVDAVTLYQSATLPSGPVYTPIHTYPIPM